MKTRLLKILPDVINCALLTGVGLLVAGQSARAANDYFGTNNVAGTGYNDATTGTTYWTNNVSEIGILPWVANDVMIFGINAGDFGPVNGFSGGPWAYTVNLSNGGDIDGFDVGATNVTITLSGTSNDHFNATPITCLVTNFSTLIWDNTRDGGFNFNKEAVTLTGPGTNIFICDVGGNDTNTLSQGAEAGGAANNTTVILDEPSPYGAYALLGSYDLYSGNLVFETTAACVGALNDITNNAYFQIGWTSPGPNPTIDNTSGSAQTLGLGLATYSLAGDFTFIGSSSLSFGAYGVQLTGTPRQITVQNNTLSIFGVISNAPSTSGDGINKLGAGTLQLGGANTYNGATLVLAGTLQLTNSGAIAGSLLVSNATFDIWGLTSSTMTSSSLSLSNSPTLVVAGASGSATNIIATTLNVDGTPVTVNVNALPPITGYPTIFPIVKGTTVNGTLNFILGTLPSGFGFQGYVTNIAASGLAELVVTNGPAPVFPVTWTGKNGGTASGTWDVQNTPDWVLSGSPITFDQGDEATFNDLSNGGSNIVSMVQPVQPSTLTVSNNATPYTFTSNGGYLANNSPGTLTLIKKGSGTLTLQESGDSFSGGIAASGGTVVVDNNSSGISGGTTIAAGATVQLGNNDVNDQLPSGGVTVNGSLVFNCADIPTTVSSALVGTGAVMQVSTNTVLLYDSGTSSGTWSTVITNGTLQPGDSSALGSLPGGTVTITNGGTLDVGGSQGGANYLNFGAKEFIVSGVGVNGGGAIINSSANEQEDAFENIVLTNNATFGGPFRWDMRNNTPVLNLNGYTLTATNITMLAMVSAVVTPGNIIVQNGANFDIELASSVTNPGTITVESGGTLGLYESSLGNITRNVVLNGGGLTNISGANETAYLNSSVLMQQSATIGNLDAGTITYYDGTISDGGNGLSLTAGGLSTNYLSGTNTYSGPTVINGTFLGLSALGSINNSSEIIVTNSGTFDLSSASQPFSGTNALVLGDDNNGQGTLNLGSSVITNFNSLSLVNPILNMAVPNPGNPNITVNNLYLGNGQGLTINITTLPALVPAQFPLIKYVNVTGTYNFSSLSLPPGYSGNLVDDTGNNSIDLQITSQPAGTWNGGGAPADNYWDDAANWSGISLTGTDPLTFTGTLGLNNTNDIASGETATAITFWSTAGAFVLNASNGVSLALAGNIVNDSAYAQTINMPINITATATTNLIFNAGTAGMLLTGGITNITSASVITIHLQGTNGTLNEPVLSPAQVNDPAISLDYVVGASNSWVMVGNNTSYLTNLTVAGGSMTIGTGSDSPDLEITNFGAQTINIGTTTNTISTLTIKSGTVESTYPNEQPLEMGASGSTGILNIVSGTLNLNGKYVQVGDTGGKGIINQSGGTVNVMVSADFILGNQTNASGILNVSGGTFNVQSNAYVGFRGPGTWNISGSGTIVCDTTVNMNRNASDSDGSSGTVNLNAGGTLFMDGEAMGNAGTPQTGAFNFNGGLLEAATNSTTFLTNAPSPNIFTATVDAGGAIINDGGFAITISAPLVHESSLGATPDGGLTKQGSGTNTLTGANTYTGNTIISAGSLALAGSGSIASSPNIIIAGGATFDVSGLTAAFTLGSSQVLSNSAVNAAINGTNNTGTGTLSLVYDGVHPSLVISSNGMNLSGNTALNIKNTSGALAVGIYAIITNANSGYVTGTVPSSFTVSGGGVAPGQPTSLQISGGVLDLVVGVLAKPADFTGISVNGNTLTITATNGADGGQFVLLESTNLLLPINQWTPILTNNFNGSGNLNLSTNIINPASPAEFYLLQMP